MVTSKVGFYSHAPEAQSKVWQGQRKSWTVLYFIVTSLGLRLTRATRRKIIRLNGVHIYFCIDWLFEVFIKKNLFSFCWEQDTTTRSDFRENMFKYVKWQVPDSPLRGHNICIGYNSTREAINLFFFFGFILKSLSTWAWDLPCHEIVRQNYSLME